MNATIPQRPPSEDAAAALAHRLVAARAEVWDDDRCQVEASSFIAVLRQRGWSPPDPEVHWRFRPRSTATPEVKAAALAEARAAIRATRPIEGEPK